MSSWATGFMWEQGLTEHNMIKDSQKKDNSRQSVIVRKLVATWLEIGDGMLFMAFRYYLVVSLINFMNIEMCHSGRQLFMKNQYTIPDSAPEVEKDLFKTSYMNSAHAIKEDRLRREFPRKHAWLAAHNDNEAEDAMAQADSSEVNEDAAKKAGSEDGGERLRKEKQEKLEPVLQTEDGAFLPPENDLKGALVPELVPKLVPEYGMSLLQLQEGLGVSVPKKPRVRAAIPEHYSGFNEDPRHWTDKSTRMHAFCSSSFYTLSTYLLIGILFVYFISLIVQLGLGLCAGLFHLLSYDDGNGADGIAGTSDDLSGGHDRSTETGIRDFCLK